MEVRGMECQGVDYMTINPRPSHKTLLSDVGFLNKDHYYYYYYYYY